MSNIEVTTDRPSATMTITTVLPAPRERVWQLRADPRQLERWWGPEPYLASVDVHDLRPGGHVAYHMTGADGDRHPGYSPGS